MEAHHVDNEREIIRSIAAGALLTVCLHLVLSSEARADEWLGADRGKLLLTSGFSTLEGAGGGSLAPLALVTSYGTSSGWGANVHVSGLAFEDLEADVDVVGVKVRVSGDAVYVR